MGRVDALCNQGFGRQNQRSGAIQFIELLAQLLGIDTPAGMKGNPAIFKLGFDLLFGFVRRTGSYLGGLAIEYTGDVALIYLITGVIVTLIPLVFAFTPLGRAEEFLPKTEAQG